MNANTATSSSCPTLPASVLLAIEKHPKTDSSAVVKAMDTERQPKMVFVSNNLRECLKRKLSESVKSGEHVPRIVNVHRSQSLNIHQNGGIPTRKTPQANGHIANKTVIHSSSTIVENAPFVNELTSSQYNKVETSLTMTRASETEKPRLVYQSDENERAKSPVEYISSTGLPPSLPDHSPPSLTPPSTPEPPLRTSSLKKHSSSSRQSSPRSRTPSPPYRTEIIANINSSPKLDGFVSGSQISPVPPAPPPPPSGRWGQESDNVIDFNRSEDETLKYFNRTVTEETTESEDNYREEERHTLSQLREHQFQTFSLNDSLSMGDNSGYLVKQNKRKVTKWSDKPKTVRASIRRGSVEELKKIFIKLGEENFKPSVIKRNNEYFLHVKSPDFTTHPSETSKFLSSSYDKTFQKSESEEKMSKKLSKKYENNWEEDETVTTNTSKESILTEQDLDLAGAIQSSIEMHTKEQAAESRYLGHTSTVEKINDTHELTQVQGRTNFEDESTRYEADSNKWEVLGSSVTESNDEFSETSKQRNNRDKSPTRNILIDSNKDLKPEEQLDRYSMDHVTSYEMSSAVVESYTLDRQIYTTVASQDTSPLDVQSEPTFTQQTSSEFHLNIGDNEEVKLVSSEISCVDIDAESLESEHVSDRNNSEINKQDSEMTAAVDMTSFDIRSAPSMGIASNRHPTVTSDSDKKEKVYVVQDNVGDLYVVEDITDTTRETTTITHPGQIVDSTENESYRTLNTTDSSIRSFDFTGVDSGRVSVQSGVDSSKAKEVISTVFGDFSGNKGLSITEYRNESLQQDNIDLETTLAVSELNSINASGQGEGQRSVTNLNDGALHEDTYEKTVFNIVTDDSNKPLWTEKTTDTQTCAWMEPTPDYGHETEQKFVSSITFGGQNSGTSRESVIIPEPDYPNEMISSSSYSTSVVQNGNEERSLVPRSSSYGTAVVHDVPAASQYTEQTSSAAGEMDEKETESEITITTRTTAVVGEMVDMHIGISPDLQSSLQDVSSSSSVGNSPRRSSIIRLRTKSPESTSPRSESLNNSRTRVSEITEIDPYSRDRSPSRGSRDRSPSRGSQDRSPSRGSPRRNGSIIRVGSESYGKSDPDTRGVQLVNGFGDIYDSRDEDRKYRVINTKEEYSNDRDSSYRKTSHYEEYMSKSSPEPKRSGTSKQGQYTIFDSSVSPVNPERYHGETDSQYSSRGTSSGVPSIGDEQPQYRVSRTELSPTRQEPHRVTYREIEETDPNSNYYTVDRRDTGGDLWRVNNTLKSESHLPNTSTTKVYLEQFDDRNGHPKGTYKIVRNLSEERIKQDSQSDSDDEGKHVYKSVKTIQISNNTEQPRQRKRRRGSRGSVDFDADGDTQSSSRYRVSNIDENTFLEKQWENRIPDDGKEHVYRVLTASPTHETRVPRRRVVPDDRDDSRIYRVGRTESPPREKKLITSKKTYHESSDSFQKTSTIPSRFDSGYFDDSTTTHYWSQPPTRSDVIQLDSEPRSRSFDHNGNDSLYKVLNVNSRDDLTSNAMPRSRRRSPNRFRSASLSSDSDDEQKGKYYITTTRHERKSPIKEYHEPKRRSTKEKNIYYVHQPPSPENVHLKRVRSLSPGRKYRISSPSNDGPEKQFVTSTPSPKSRSYVVYTEHSPRPRDPSPKPLDSHTYRTEKTIVLQPSRSMSPRLQHKSGKYFSQNGLSMDQTFDSGTGTEIASSDNEGNGEIIRQRRYERVEEIYEVRKDPQFVELDDDVEGDLKVQRGKILIQNQMDPTKDDDEFDDNINVFDNSFHLQKDNPLYQSDPDIYRKLTDYDNQQDAFQKEVTQDITFETVNKIAQSHKERQQVVQQPNKKPQLSALLLSKLANIDSKDVRQTIDVEHHNEEIYGDIQFIHADGQRTGSANTNNFDAVNENVGLTLRDGKAYVTIKVVAERIVPIDYEFNVWRKSSAIVTRQIEIDLLANEQRRRLYHHVMESAGPQGAIAGSIGPEVPPRFHDDQKTLSSLETLKLFSQILNVAEGEGDNDVAEYYTRQEQGRLPSSSAFDILY